VSAVITKNAAFALRFLCHADGLGFSLMPWKPVTEQRLGQQIAAARRRGVLGAWPSARSVADLKCLDS